MNDRDLIFEQYKLIKEEEEKPVMTVSPRGTKKWKLSNGKFHRLDGPAIEGHDGHKQWWANGLPHREDGPAIENTDGTKEWWVNGQHHREDGPAIEWADGTKEWFLNNKRYPGPEEWAEAVLKLHNKPHDKESIEEFLRDILSKIAEDLL